MPIVNPLWIEIAGRAGVTLSAAQGEAMGRYLDLLLAANERMNLTRITDRAAAEEQHVADALTLLAWMPGAPHRLVDVGSGGGVPGLVLAIARPDVEILLVESTNKKAQFLREATGGLGLKNVTIAAERAEALAKDERREGFDVCTARAVADLETLAGWCLPLVRVGGKLLAMKGPRIADELPVARQAIRAAGGGEAAVHPAGLGQHVVVEIRKQRTTKPRGRQRP